MALKDSFTTDNGLAVVSYGAYWRAQTFTSGSSYTITSVKLKLFKTGSPGDFTVSIRATSGGVPTGSDLCSGTLAAASIPTSAAVTEITLGAGTALTNGTKYAIVFRAASSDASNDVRFNGNAGSSPNYAGGDLCRSSDSGGSWTASGTSEDLYFETYESVVIIIPSGIASTLVFGKPSLAIVPPGIASTLVFGKPSLAIVPQGIASSLAFGVPALSVIIRPTGIASTLSFGTPFLSRGLIVVAGIPSTLAFGVPAIVGGTIRPIGIASTIVFGIPVLIVFLPHVILEASYFEESPDVNYVFVVGEDSAGNQVTGSAEDTTESALIGSRLDVTHDSSIPSSTAAASVASAALAHARLSKKRALITIPPHCALELWDVINVSDNVSNQSTSYRVTAFTYEYDVKRALCQHRIALSAL